MLWRWRSAHSWILRRQQSVDCKEYEHGEKGIKDRVKNGASHCCFDIDLCCKDSEHDN